MFRPVRILNAGTNVPEIFRLPATAGTAYKAGDALVLTSGALTHATATVKPTYVAAADVGADSTFIPVYAVTPNMIFEAPVTASPAALVIGSVVTLAVDSTGSNRFGETIVGQNEFDVFRATEEGNGAENDTVAETYRKFIEHIQFTKEFVITAEMMEDANYGVGADAKRRAENFTRAYYKTIHKICEYALANGTATSGSFAKAALDLTAPDGKPLFSSSHDFGIGDTKGTQSNFFYGDIFASGADTRTRSAAAFEEALGELAVKLRNMKDENGEHSAIPPTR